MAGGEQLSIGELAVRTGVPVSALRYYDQVGVLVSTGRSAGQRVFDAGAVVRVQAVLLAQRAGFSLTEIRTLLAEPDGAGDVERLVSTKLEDVRRRRAELDAAERMLVASRDAGRCDFDVCALAVAPAGDGVSARSGARDDGPPTRAVRPVDRIRRGRSADRTRSAPGPRPGARTPSTPEESGG